MLDYSEKTLKDKLGLTDDMSTYFLKAPSEYFAALGKKPQTYDDIFGEYDFIHAFFTEKDAMSNFAELLLAKMAPKGILWVSWPKKSARAEINSDITEQDLRNVFLPLGVVDVKVCTVTDQWSGLKFVLRKHD